ncbi:CCA tRNA nucleotidyltransferase, partial [Patescibacteria group bacterium]|nr:CCA tRNA nucleotidyltransferase [Patescibacteria group bacterium]
RFAELIAKYQLDEQAVTPLLQGRDLIEVFGLAPGKQLGELLQLVEHARDEGMIRTREEALAFVKKLPLA